MPSISLAKALKLKNRLVGRLNKVQNDIVTYNSVLEEQGGKVDVLALFKLRDEIAEHLIVLKTKIIAGNSDIQSDLIRHGELKAKLAWLATLDTRDGRERHGYQNTEVTWVATLKKNDLDAETRKLEAEIDAIQDKLDTFNHTQTFLVSERTLQLAS